MPDTSVIDHPQRGILPESLLVFYPDEAAKILKVSRASLYRRVRDGEWPHRKIGKQGVRFTIDDLQAILADCHRPAVER